MNETKANIVEILQAEARIRGEEFQFERTTIVKNGTPEERINVFTGDSKESILIAFPEYPNEFCVMEEVDNIFSGLKEYFLKKEKYKQEILDWDKIKDRIIPTLINTKLNEDLLQYCPKEEIHDLSVLYAIILDDAKIDIRYGLLETWGVNEKTLREQAQRNLLNNIVLNPIMDDLVQMVVITNRWESFGASAILTETAQAELVEKLGEAPFICPLSRHQMIAYPRSLADLTYIKNMVHDINRDILDPKDFLSDSVYTIREGKFVIEC